MMLSVERSPARVCWHVKCKGQLISTAPTKEEAEKLRRRLERQFELKTGQRWL